MLIHQIDSRALRGCPGAETSKTHDQPFKRSSTCDLDLSSLERERLHRTLDTVPNDVHNGLEIGFYDFRFTSLLRARIDLVSMDLPRKVNNTGGYKLIFADMQHLPFRAKAFDIIICTEVLEHLPEKVLIKAVGELQRVSGKYLLISVPYKQRVWNELFKCANCSFVCNSMGHLHYMDERRLSELFNRGIAEKTERIGTLNGYAPDWLYSIAKTLGNVWCDFNFGNCPKCDQSDKAVAANLVGHVLRRLIWRMELRAKPRAAWVISLFKVSA